MMKHLLSHALMALGFAILTSAANAQSLYINDPAQFGTRLNTVSSCDDCNEQVSFSGAGQSIQFFGTEYSTAFVSSNGLLTFGTGYSGYSPQPLDTQTLRPMIAGIFTDLDARPARSNIYLNDATPGQLVITWESMSTFSQDATNSTFQLVIRSDQFAVPAGEGQIGFFYGVVESGRNASAGFGDGLADSNPGEVSLFVGIASEQSLRAPSWFTLGAGGVPVDPDEPPVDVSVEPIPTLGEWAMIALAALMIFFAAGRIGGATRRT